MNVVSLFSGVGGMDRGLEAAGHDVIAMCEIDPHARSVLARHWPDVPIHHDVTTFDPKELRGTVDLVAGGSPCQDLSVAGRRNGLDGERSGLFWHQCRVAAVVDARWILWENVAGALSSNDGEDFASVLWGFTGLRPTVPANGWRSIGMCVGPDRTAVWRLLDARWFGVAQRRRRVFVVVGPRTECRPEILVEPESCPRDFAPSAQAGDSHAVGALGGTGPGGGWRFGADEAAAGQLIPAAVSENQRGEVRLTPYARQITTGGGKPGQGYPAVLAFDANHSGQYDITESDQAPPVKTSHNGPAVAYPVALRSRGDELGDPDLYNALMAGVGSSSRNPTMLTPDLAVRRLTPRECERLMGWPDDWTRYGDPAHLDDQRFKDAGVVTLADSHRYRMCGNGVVSPCTEWIGRRLPKVAA